MDYIVKAIGPNASLVNKASSLKNLIRFLF